MPAGGGKGGFTHRQGAYETVILYFTVLPLALIVMVVVPLPLATMRPALSTVATVFLDEAYVTLTPVALAEEYLPVT